MRIVIDMQGAQTESRFRGIGRYTMAFAQAVVRNRGEHEIILALSGLFPDTIEPIRAAFDGLLPQENIRVWFAPGPTREVDAANTLRREIAERIREGFLASLRPDVVLVTSLFEGWSDDAVTSIGVFDRHIPVAVILYDLIPLINPDIHFRSSRILHNYYTRKIKSLKRSSRLLAISESARQEALGALHFDEDAVINISGACAPSFCALNLSEPERRDVCSKIGIVKPFVMYTGGADDRKNLHRLIRAWAALPESIRNAHQLALVGKMPQGNVMDFMQTAKDCGLRDREMVVTGYVEDEDLLKLYNSCKLFVFPSLHEGFGLPPLEAMACRAPVIVANATSLPEVVGRGDAMFDPESVESICKKMEQALTDESFRASLIAHGSARAQLFSWDNSAKRALEALQAFDSGRTDRHAFSLRIDNTAIFRRKKQRILVMKLDHMGDFILAIPAITKLRARYPYASIDVVVGTWNGHPATALGVFDNIYTLDFFKKKSSVAASIIDTEVTELLAKLPAYDMALDLRRQSDTRFLLAKAKAKLKIGYATFDNAIDSKIDILIESYPDAPFEATPLNKESISLQMLRLVDAIPGDVNDFVSFPKLSDESLTRVPAIAIFQKAGNDVKEWGAENYRALMELLARDERVAEINVYFSNADEAGESGIVAEKKIRVHVELGFSGLVRSLSGNTVCVANNSFGAHLSAYLGLGVIAIYGGHETVAEWGPVFGNSRVIHAAASCSPCHIAKREDCRNQLHCLSDISVEFVFAQIMEMMQSGHHPDNGQKRMTNIAIAHQRSNEEIIKDLLESIAEIGSGDLSEGQQIAIASSVAASIVHHPLKRLFVDVSELVQRDVKTGIQRVVRSILQEWLNNPPGGYCVEPVYATVEQGYRYARQFTARFLGIPGNVLPDEPIDYAPGDVFFGLDLQPQVQVAQWAFFQALRRQGVTVKFAVYDLLCVLMPQCFPDGSAKAFGDWLEVVAESDGAVCISKAVADEFGKWVEQNGPVHQRPIAIDWFHLGADVDNSRPTKGLPEDADTVLGQLRARSSFLMVGTLEPRKGHAQVLDAFEQFWRSGVDINLVVVGKQGWMVESLVARLCDHPEVNKHLFWLEGISDEYLEKVYAASTCLIAASSGEGFGLPLIEAAQHKLPIIARDIPVFREVAGEHAYYFDASTAHGLAQSIKAWLARYAEKQIPLSENLPYITWKQSAAQLMSEVISKM